MKAKRKKVSDLLFSQKFAPYLFVSPFLLSFLVFFLYPVISTFQMSFYEILPGESTFVGLDNYKKLWNDQFFTSFSNSLRYTFWTLVILIPIPLLLAVFLNSKVLPGRNIFRSALFMPALTSVIVGGMIFNLMFGQLDTALINSLLIKLGLEPKKWNMEAETGMFLMVLLASWRWMGVNILYFLAGLQNIDKGLYEAAEIDGANAFQKFMRITVPLLKPVTIYVLTISIYGGFRMFEESYVFWQNQSPGDIGLTIVGYLYKEGFEYNNFGLGSAIGIVLMFIVLTVNLLQLKYTGLFKKED
ncbi:carbohydrate ABC transporter permease [Ammoniphilus sp. 3BR4]|uniref:carbohydrate ABC transporter permease n=1 Tax=Ammoniphilus sp. 3BR4 TaxID=3158265 RepID=UPI00346796E2